MPQGSDSPSLMDTIRAHPVRSVLLATPVALVTICCAIAQSWQSFTDKKIPDWFSQNLGWVFTKFPSWQLWLFAASIVAVYCLGVYVLFRPRRSTESRASRAKYFRVLSELAEKKTQKASDENSGGYSILASIAADARERSRDEALRPKPNLIAQFKYVGIYGMTGGAGITVRLEIRNTGTPSIADKFTATLSSDGFSDELFPAPMPPNACYADETGGMKTIKPSETLYQKLRQPIQSGNRVRGFLFYFAEGVSPAQLTAREPTEIVIRFRDVTFREYTVSSKGVKPLYPPGVVDQFDDTGEEADTAEERQALLVKISELVRSSAKAPLDERIEVIGALVRFVSEFKNEEHVVWTCDQLERRGFPHPFKVLSSGAPGAFEGRYLSFLQDARTCPIEVKALSNAMSCVAKYWRYSDEYKRVRRAYIGFPETDDADIQLTGRNPRLEALGVLKALRDEGDRLINTFRTKGASAKKPTAQQVTTYINQVAAMITSKALDLTNKEAATFNLEWPKQDLYAITKELAVAGCFEGDELGTFSSLWDRVERLKELTATLENKG